MRFEDLFDRLEKQMNFRPSVKNIADILDADVKTLYARAKRGTEFKNSEIEKIECHYAIKIDSGLQVDCVEIDYISINPSCGKGTVVLDNADITPIKIGKEIIKNLWNAKPENLKLFKASGDSMAESIEDGNVLLVDISRTDYHNGGIYILQINGDWFCKRLRLRITGELDIISDNSKYPIETLKPNTDVEIKVMGRVIKNLSRGL